MSKHSACPIECTLLQFFHLIDIISLIVIAVIDSFHIHIPIINQIRQRISQNILDFNILYWTGAFSQYVQQMTQDTLREQIENHPSQYSPFVCFLQNHIFHQKALYESPRALRKNPALVHQVFHFQTAFFLLICS